VRSFKGERASCREKCDARSYRSRTQNNRPNCAAQNACRFALNSLLLTHTSLARADLEQPEMTEEERAKARILELAEQPFVNLLILSAFTVAFAHGGNDVGNAVGPLCAILSVYNDGKVLETPDIPMWALCLGGAGFCFGIVLLGSNTISTVGTKITKLTPSKSYATQIGAAVAVLLSSAMGLPVSTSHCLVGSVIGIGMVQKCMGAEGSLNFGVLKKIVLGWAVTIPLAMLVSVIIFLPLRPLFE